MTPRCYVIGAGIAGAAFARASAPFRETIVCEQQHCLGGVTAQGHIRSICGLAANDSAEPHLLEPAAAEPWLADLHDGRVWKLGRVWLWGTNPERIQTSIQQALRTCRLQRGTSVSSLVQSDGYIRSIHLDNGDSFQVSELDWVIDASGNAYLPRSLGIPCNNSTFWASIRVEIATANNDGFSNGKPSKTFMRNASKIAPATVACYPIAHRAGYHQLSVDLPPGSSNRTAHQVVSEICKAWQTPLVSHAIKVAERDHGRAQGQYTAQELFSTSSQQLCWGSWPVEWHGQRAVQWQWPERDRYGIPETITEHPSAPKNMRFLGKALPVAPDAAAALRVMGTAIHMGTALAQRLCAPAQSDTIPIKNSDQ